MTVVLPDEYLDGRGRRSHVDRVGLISTTQAKQLQDSESP
jgi:hypothetical protein